MPNVTPLLLSTLATAAEELAETGPGGVATVVARIEFVRASEGHHWIYRGPLRLTTAEPGRGIVGVAPTTAGGLRMLEGAIHRYLAGLAEQPRWWRTVQLTGGQLVGADTVVVAEVTIQTRRWSLQEDPNGGPPLLVCGGYVLTFTEEDIKQLRAATLVADVQRALFNAVRGNRNAERRLQEALTSGGENAQTNLEEIRDVFRALP